MSEKHIVKRSLSERRQGATDWEQVRKLDDAAIDRAIATDPDAAPAVTDDWFEGAKVVMPEPKVPISIRIDREVLDWFKDQGPAYQSRMNAVLKAYMSSRKAG
ncbi:MAG: BrnA antitoxin family protein [Rhodospirillaceae bacterium]|nr:BrnA antitoxin family protein [Rhodospirillales bacterium]